MGNVSRNRKPALLRGLVAASLAIFVALAAHVTSGGAMPGPLGILVPWILAVMVCTLLAGRRLSAVRLSVSVTVSQLLFHTLFVLGAITPSTTMGGHTHGMTMTLPAGTPIAEAVLADSSMWLGHAIAAVVTVVALHRGERTLVRLCALSRELGSCLRRRLIIVFFPAPPFSGLRRSRIAAEDERLPDDPLRTVVRRRGPPLLLSV